MKRKQFTFYRSFYEAMVLLPKRFQLEYLQGIITFALDDQEPEFTSEQVESLFVLIKPVLETAKRRAKSGVKGAEATAEIREIVSGKPGGKPGGKVSGKVGGKVGGKQGGEKENEIEIENEIENEIEIEIEIESDSIASAFGEFWAAYPKRIGKTEAFLAWRETVTDPIAVMNSLREWLQCPEWLRENGRFVPKPEKWLRQRYFEETPKGVVYRGATGELGEAEIQAIRAMVAESQGGDL